ncbi:MAG: hypothetical protein K9J27_07450 [Bacteroidales bacterium]|nr:hypothetical protein [Bacteroidales bacterium]MCF8333326.1 hypothetical protein [Bacteroidales bacterium]
MMHFVIDSNTVFSAILNPNSNIGQIILNGSKYFTFLSSDLLFEEIKNHENKILKISGLEYQDYSLIYSLIKTKLKFINQNLIEDKILQKAYHLTMDIDPKDTLYIALSIQFNCKLWTGDNKLIAGLKKKGIDQFITTNEIFRLYLEKEYKSRKK